MRHLSSLLHGCGKRVKRASHLLLVIAGLWACRRAAPPTRSSTDAVEGRDARPDAVCASRLSRFRADLEKLREENARLEDRLHRVEAKGSSSTAPPQPDTPQTPASTPTPPVAPAAPPRGGF